MRRKLNILITGGSRGIGNAIAMAVASRSRNLLLTSLHKEMMDIGITKIKDIDAQHLFRRSIDQSDAMTAAKTLHTWAESIVTHLDVLILCAGNYFEGNLCNIDLHEFENSLQTNFLFNYYAVRQLVPMMKKGDYSRIIIIGSTAAYNSYYVPSYGVAKWALRGLAVNLREELSVDKIGVTFLSPGSTLTDMWSDVAVPENRILSPTDIATVVRASLDLSNQAVIDEIIIRPMLGDFNE